MSSLEDAVVKRLILVDRIKSAFFDLFPGSKAKIHLHRGRVQQQIFVKIDLTATSRNRDLINDVLNSIGYRKIFIHGVCYYKRTDSFQNRVSP